MPATILPRMPMGMAARMPVDKPNMMPNAGMNLPTTRFETNEKRVNEPADKK